MENVSNKVTGDILTANEYTDGGLQELKNLVESSNQVLDDADQFQLAQAGAVYAGAGDFYTDTGAANAYVASLVSPRKGPIEYVSGLRVRMIPGNTNSGASTVNVNALGVKDIEKFDGTALSAGDILADRLVELVYIGGATDAFIIFNEAVNQQNVLPTGFISGIGVSTDTDSDHDILFATGSCRDATDYYNIKFGTALTKQIDANWAAGDDAGGFPTGLTLSADTWYHLYVISKADGTTDAGFDTSLTAANLLADATGYTLYRRVGSVLTDGSNNILDFVQQIIGMDRYVLWDAPVKEVDVSGFTAGVDQTFTLSTPNDFVTNAIINFVFGDTVSGNNIYIYPGFATTRTAHDTNAPLASGNTEPTKGTIQKMYVLTDTSSQVKANAELTSVTSGLRISTLGYVDNI